MRRPLRGRDHDGTRCASQRQDAATQLGATLVVRLASFNQGGEFVDDDENMRRPSARNRL